MSHRASEVAIADAARTGADAFARRTRAIAGSVPPLGNHVHVPAGTYRLGEPGEERLVELGGFSIGAWPIVTTHLSAFLSAGGTPALPEQDSKLSSPALADHPATDVTFHAAEAFGRWASSELGTRARLPTGDEWEAAARGLDGRAWPWGDVFEPGRCATAETAPGWTVPVTAHPEGASAFGAFDMAGNVWEWVLDATEDGAWRSCRGGSYLDHAWGARSSRSLPADPARATPNTGFRLVFEGAHMCVDRGGWHELRKEVS
jgi:formylglycine-generating enzyme required for sulfatase activity